MKLPTYGPDQNGGRRVRLSVPAWHKRVRAVSVPTFRCGCFGAAPRSALKDLVGQGDGR